MQNQSSLNPLEKANELYHKFPESFQSIILGTVDNQGIPHASYAPFVMDEEKNIYLLASDLAVHTQDLLSSAKASVLFIEEEGQSQQIFARARLSFNCTATIVTRETEQWQTITQKLQERFGEIVTVVSQMMDFYLFKLTPQGGRFVSSFGQIYDINEDNFNCLVPVKGKGHRSSE